MSIHSDHPVNITVQDAVQTDLDQRTSLLVMEKFGHELKKSKSGKYRLLYTFSDKIFGYTYAIQNLKDRELKIKLDCSKSENMLFSTPNSIVTKTISKGETEFFMHCMAHPSNENKRISNHQKGIQISIE